MNGLRKLSLHRKREPGAVRDPPYIERAVSESDAKVVDVGGACGGVISGKVDAACHEAIPARERRRDLIVGFLVASAMQTESSERQVADFRAVQRRLRISDTALIEHHEVA